LGYDGKSTRSGPIYDTIAYLLSHTAIDGRKQTVRWIGILSNNKMEVTRTEATFEYKECPVCGKEMHKFRVRDGVTTEVNNEKKVRYKYYKFREFKK
ncbi:unnamed protein product, partial [marine sediment metagenome]